MPVPLELPEQVDQHSFLGGYAPDSTDGADYTPSYIQGTLASGFTTMDDALNVLPDPETGALRTRHGFQRITDNANLLGSGFVVRNIFCYSLFDFDHDDNLRRYIICVLTDFSAGANNVQIWAYDLLNDTAARIDPAGRTWYGNGTEDHWQVSVLDTIYGGQRGEPMYSWSPTGGWNADCAAPNYRTLLNSVDATINTDIQYGNDFAFKVNTKVKYGAKSYVTTRDIRFQTWVVGQEYERSDRVTIAQAWGQSGTAQYFKSFKCIKAHTASTVLRPGNGSGAWQTNWQPIHLDLPLDAQGDVTSDWDLIPVASQTGLGIFHANRLWLRGNSKGYNNPNPNRLQYSAPIKPRHGDDIGTVAFDPSDFAPDYSLDGDGGGWIDFYTTEGDAIQGLWSTGQYLLVFKRRSTWVISGFSQATWSVRRLAHVGCMRPNCIAELNGLVYFLSDEGLYVTDGTMAQEADGLDKFREYLITLAGNCLHDTTSYNPQMWAYRPFIWISLPIKNAPVQSVLVYHPDSGSLYPLDMPVLDAAVMFERKNVIMYLAGAPDTSKKAIVYQYNHPSNPDQDDLGQAAVAGAHGSSDITWKVKTPWYIFSVNHEERRIRRTWALVKGALNFTLQGFVDANPAANYSYVTTGTGKAFEHAEGEVMPDAHAIQFQLTGAKAPASVLSFSALTETRRLARYKVPIS